MINKAKAAGDLKNIVVLEEDFVAQLAGFLKALSWKRSLSPDKVKMISEGLEVLHLDSKRHALIVEEMIKYVQESGKDEF